MRQRLTSIILIFTLTASVLAGAIGVSINIANADTDHFPEGYFDELADQARLVFQNSASTMLSNFDTLVQYAKDNWDNVLVVVLHDDNTNNWYFAVYEPYPGQNLTLWSFLNSNKTQLGGIYSGWGYNRVYCKYVVKTNGSGYYANMTYRMVDYLDGNSYSSTIYSDSGYAYVPSPIMANNVPSRLGFFNKDFYYWTGSGSNYSVWHAKNLLPTSPIPDPIEFHWFKFNLGDRWYITTYDQSFVNGMVQEDDLYLIWLFNVWRSDSAEPEVFSLWSPDMVRIPYAETFISQNVTNISNGGIYAYDITDWINDPMYQSMTDSEFYMMFDGPFGDPTVEYEYGYSNDVVSLILRPDEEDPARTEAWTIVNNYFENYPTVTIVPDQLASQLTGNKAVTGGSGRIQIPEQLYKWRYDGLTTIGIDSEFHYDLSTTGLDPDDSTQVSMINYDILNVCIIPSRPDATIDYQFGHPIPLHTCIWDYRYENDANDFYKVNVSVGANMTYEDVFDFYDLILIVPGDVFCTLDPRSTYTWSSISSTFGLDARMAYTGGDVVRGHFAEHGNGDAEFPCYWVLTENAVRKSQLYVFCDGFSKLYKLASEYVQKKDLWDNSFFEWSMSIFYQLESINGHLSSIQTVIQSIDSKIDTMIQNLQDLNTDPTEDTIEPWYLSLWNFVRQFNPSNDQVSTGINALSDNLEDLPALPAPSAAPALPTFAP